MRTKAVLRELGWPEERMGELGVLLGSWRDGEAWRHGAIAFDGARVEALVESDGRQEARLIWLASGASAGEEGFWVRGESASAQGALSAYKAFVAGARLSEWSFEAGPGRADLSESL